MNGPGEIGGAADVSRETHEQLEIHISLLRRWQRVQNLVAPSTLEAVWDRHVADSLQLVALRPDARSWLDLGSGGGFPGLVVAICCRGRPGFRAHLVESNSRKVAFLRAVIRATGAPAVVHDSRIEHFAWPEPDPPDTISARALAPLTVLCGYAEPFMGDKTVAIFHKGREFESEIKTALHDWNLDLVVRDSMVDADGRLIEIRAINPIKPL